MPRNLEETHAYVGAVVDHWFVQIDGRTMEVPLRVNVYPEAGEADPQDDLGSRARGRATSDVQGRCEIESRVARRGIGPVTSTRTMAEKVAP